jgi:hypothetical protein
VLFAEEYSLRLQPAVLTYLLHAPVMPTPTPTPATTQIGAQAQAPSASSSSQARGNNAGGGEARGSFLSHVVTAPPDFDHILYATVVPRAKAGAKVGGAGEWSSEWGAGATGTPAPAPVPRLITFPGVPNTAAAAARSFTATANARGSASGGGGGGGGGAATVTVEAVMHSVRVRARTSSPPVTTGGVTGVTGVTGAEAHTIAHTGDGRGLEVVAEPVLVTVAAGNPTTTSEVYRGVGDDGFVVYDRYCKVPTRPKWHVCA